MEIRLSEVGQLDVGASQVGTIKANFS